MAVARQHASRNDVGVRTGCSWRCSLRLFSIRVRSRNALSLTTCATVHVLRAKCEGQRHVTV
jgi:hypothetical protein